MNLTQIVKSILPPKILDFALLLKDNLGFYEWKYVSNSWKDINQKDEKGWDLQEIATLQTLKWKSYKELVSSNKSLGINHESSLPYKIDDLIFHNLIMSYAYVLALTSKETNSLKILDWGGGIGHYGLLSKSLLPMHTKIEYNCYDLESFIIIAKDIWENESIDTIFSSDRLLFLDNKKYNLVLASSSIWYEPNWKEVFKDLVSVTINYIYITRMIFIKGDCPSYVALQRPSSMGYKTSYHFWVLNEDEFINYASTLGIEMVREFIFTKTIKIYKAPVNGKIKGYLFKVKDN